MLFLIYSIVCMGQCDESLAITKATAPIRIQNSLITHLTFGFGLYFAYLIFFKLIIGY